MSNQNHRPARAGHRAALLATTALLIPLALAGAASAQAARSAAATPPTNTAGENGTVAQTGASTDNEVVVTAQKRVQSVQDVPVSVEVLDTRKLDQLQIQKFQDYVKYLPSISTSGSAPGNNATVVARGIATDGGNYIQGALPTVGVYLDEQPITDIGGAVDLHVYDIARVESLAGPQGTLFGASSEAGTIRLITNKPDPNKFSAGYDLELNKFTAGAPGGITEGFINQPLGDRAALRVVGFYEHDGGYIDNLPSSRTYPVSGITVNNRAAEGKDFNMVDTEGGRATLAIKLNENWTVTPSILGQYRYNTGSFTAFPARGDLVTQRYDKEWSHDRFYQAGLTITGKIADLDFTYAGSYLRQDAISHGDYADYSYFYDVLDGSGTKFFDNSGRLIDPTQTFIPSGTSQKISQEARLATPSTWRLRGIAGIFYQRQSDFFRYDYQVANLANSLNVTGNPGSYYLDVGERVDRDFAVFTQGDFDVTSHLTFTAGMRYYRYDNTLTDFNGTKGAEAGCIGPALVKGEPCTSLGIIKDGRVAPVEVEDDGFTYRFNATYKTSRDHLFYATVSDGFRPGGTNSRSTVNPGASITYGAEHLTNYEVGTKNTFWNRRATLDVTGFWEEWDGLQLSVETFSALTGTGGIFTIQNAGKARSRGVELDYSIKPITGLTLTSASTYTRAELTEDYNNGFNVIAPKGETLPFTPALKTNLIARYEFNLSGFRTHVQAAELYQSSAWNNFETSNRNFYGRRNAYAITDMTAGVEKNSRTFEVFISNLLDRRGVTKKVNGCGVGTCNADQYVFYNQPRLIGMRFGQRF